MKPITSGEKATLDAIVRLIGQHIYHRQCGKLQMRRGSEEQQRLWVLYQNLNIKAP
jgi:hypothetical protein